MRAKLSATGQITLPAEILDRLPRTETFELEVVEGAILLRPVTDPTAGLERLRSKMRALGHSEMIVQEAVTWARSS
jgi:bifunctional DNA-binding transcriptional regulator/antitoxin component of YhaV-PrlF toxin-antitoxin module